MPEPTEHIRVRAVLDALPSYVPGRPASAPDGMTAYKISSNENPYPPLPSVQEEMTRALSQVNRYPDLAVTALTEDLAEHLGVPATCLATGTGSVGVLGSLIQAMCDAGDEVVYAWRSFEAYPIVVALAGARSVPVPLDAGHRHDLAAMAAAVTERTKVVIVCTPNNPTGTTVTSGELEAFCEAVPDDVLIVVDEAYLEFVTVGDAPDAMQLWRRRGNVAVLRTFSKAYGLAGLRVGYAIAHPALAAALRKAAVPFGVNSLAQTAARASLRVTDELEQRVAALVAERTRVAAALAEQGWRLPDSQANFVWFPLGERSGEFAAACERVGLVVRAYGADGVRATIGEVDANDRLVEVAGAWSTS